MGQQVYCIKEMFIINKEPVYQREREREYMGEHVHKSITLAPWPIAWSILVNQINLLKAH